MTALSLSAMTLTSGFGRTDGMKLAGLVLGPIGNNVFMGADEETGDGFIVDPTMWDDRIPEELVEIGVKELRYILLTHGHYDHILGVSHVHEAYPSAKVVISKGDAIFLSDPEYSLCAKHEICQPQIKADILVEDGSVLPFGNSSIKVMETPGHTQGSVCYLFPEEQVMLAGDTVFRQSYGRTDLKSGNMEEMAASLYRIGQIEGDYNILPGHGPLTTLAYERNTNIYMRQK